MRSGTSGKVGCGTNPTVELVPLNTGAERSHVASDPANHKAVGHGPTLQEQ